LRENFDAKDGLRSPVWSRNWGAKNSDRFRKRKGLGEEINRSL